MKLPTLDKLDLKNKKVFVRGDIDVPLNPLNDTRLKDIWPTVDYLLKQSCTVYLAGHLGRPGGKEDLSLSSKPVAQWFAEGKSVSGVCLKGNICGFLVSEKLIVLENLRFDPREEANDENYAKELASLAEVYVNEAFAASERAHASMVGVPKFLPHFAGFRLAKEIEVLAKVLENPARPLLVIIGGAKIETKQPLIDRMKNFADTVIVGGKLATQEKDFMIDSLPQAKTIVWNGTMGMIEDERYQAGTKKLVDLILENKEAYKIVGGGDTVGFLDKIGLTSKFDWVCSGGGSMLKFLSGEKLPGIEALL